MDVWRNERGEDLMKERRSSVRDGATGFHHILFCIFGLMARHFAALISLVYSAYLLWVTALHG